MEWTAELVEREYNNRALVPDYAAFFARWESDSAFVRETLPGKLDLAYGPDPRHRIDAVKRCLEHVAVEFHGAIDVSDWNLKPVDDFHRRR